MHSFHRSIGVTSVLFLGLVQACSSDYGHGAGMRQTDAGSAGKGGSAGTGGSGGEVTEDAGQADTGTAGSGGEDDAGVASCGLTTSDVKCDACMNAKCYSECYECAHSTDCNEFINCVSGCSDQACRENCATSHSAGAQLMIAVSSTCMGQYCTDACN